MLQNPAVRYTAFETVERDFDCATFVRCRVGWIIAPVTLMWERAQWLE